jgi:ribosomal protein S18 acetylase RimI-like enzyme
MVPDAGPPLPDEPSPSGPLRALPASRLAIVRPLPSERTLAVQALLRADAAAAERFLAFASEHRMSLDAIWSMAAPDGRIGWSVLAAPNPGRTATLFTSPVRTVEELEIVATLVGEALAGLAGMDVHLVQALVEPGDTRLALALERGGMRRITTLGYLERTLPRRGAFPAPTWPADLRLETWDPTRRAELIAALEASYVATLDCPELAGLRSGEDILDGHRHSGRYESSLWSVLRAVDGPHAGAIAGMALCNSSPGVAMAGLRAPGSVELVYFGLVPFARRRGLGRLLLQHALHRLEGRDEATVTLAVDERNEPAKRLYRECGFRSRFRRIAFIRPLARR